MVKIAATILVVLKEALNSSQQTYQEAVWDWASPATFLPLLRDDGGDDDDVDDVGDDVGGGVCLFVKPVV